MKWHAPADVRELRAIIAERTGRDSRSGPLLATGAAPPGAGTGPPDTGTGPPGTATGDAAVVASISAPAFSRIIEYEPRDLTVTAGAGMRASRLAALLREDGQWLPAAERSARSVGGLVAAAPTGPFDTSHGGLRRHLLAVRVVAPDGGIQRWGRAVMKNVAGYHVQGLHGGGQGRLGVITAATFRVWPLPERDRSFELTGPDQDAMIASAATIDPADAFRPDAMVWHWRGAEEAAGFTIRFVGTSASVEARIQRMLPWAGRHGFAAAETAASHDGSEPARAGHTALRLTLHPGRLAESLQGLRAGLVGVTASIEAYPGAGVVRVAYRHAEDSEERAERMNSLLAACGEVSVRIERGTGVEHSVADARRSAAVRALEERLVDALGGSPRHWVADYV